jgi:hypothetical protein
MNVDLWKLRILSHVSVLFPIFNILYHQLFSLVPFLRKLFQPLASHNFLPFRSSGFSPLLLSFFLFYWSLKDEFLLCFFKIMILIFMFLQLLLLIYILSLEFIVELMLILRGGTYAYTERGGG